jgi:hypothetical protein
MLETVLFPELRGQVLESAVDGGEYGFVKEINDANQGILIVGVGGRVEGVDDWLA